MTVIWDIDREKRNTLELESNTQVNYKMKKRSRRKNNEL